LTHSWGVDAAEDLARIAVARVIAKRTDPLAWRAKARPEQLPPDEFTDWYVRGGRGSGKTWAASHTLAELQRIVVAIDPAVSNTADSDETGIVVAGRGVDGLAYVMQDRSGRMAPSSWARMAVDAYKWHAADRIVAEANNGGEMVRLTLGTVDANVPITLVHASRGKQARAEPVMSLYEQSKVFHVEPMPDLEDQMCNWDPREGGASPDRIDALVWAITDLMLDDPWGGYGGSSIA
jgi:phage terminase large subunit-like protein